MPLKLDPSLVEKWKAEHGADRVKLLNAAGEEIAVRAPSKEIWARFEAWSQDERRRGAATEQLVRDCLLAPEAPQFEVLIARKPGLVRVFANKIAELAGVGVEAEVKNL